MDRLALERVVVTNAEREDLLQHMLIKSVLAEVNEEKKQLEKNCRDAKTKLAACNKDLVNSNQQFSVLCRERKRIYGRIDYHLLNHKIFANDLSELQEKAIEIRMKAFLSGAEPPAYKKRRVP